MRKIINSLVINITDICNMSCGFCLRGDSGNNKMDLSLIPRIFEGIDIIDQITITGGEPGCYVEAVTQIADYLMENKDKIDVNGFSIITNAKIYKQELVDVVKNFMFLYIDKLYGQDSMNITCYVSDIIDELQYRFSISVSLDEYHESINTTNYLKYYMSGVYSAIKECNFSPKMVIARGLGEGIPGSRYVKYRELYVSENNGDIEAEEVYITVKGKVFGDCDMSYEMELCNEPAGNLKEETLAEILQRRADMDAE